MNSQLLLNIIIFFSAVLLTTAFFLWKIKKSKTGLAEESNIKKQLELEKITSFFSASLVDKNNTDDVLWDVSSNLIGKLDFEDCMIYLWNKDKTVLEQKAGYGQKGAMQYIPDKEKYNVNKGQGIIGAAAALQAPLIINDTSQDTRYRTADGIIRLSEICVPIVKDEEQIGMINAEASHKNFFNQWHVQTLATIATLIANKIKAVETAAALHGKQLELASASSRLATAELSLLRSQMNPHFIFNSLNSVQKYIWENKEEDAAEYLASFARLMRAILENSRYEFIPLKQEAEILKLYVELEHRRSNHNFDYVIKIDEKLDMEATLIPPMLLQPFIENAIWHGLNKKKEKGNLFVHIFKQENQLVCVVDDDGVGRQQLAHEPIEKKSLGISITQQRINRLMENTSKTAAVTIKDKTKDDRQTGTEVTVILPLNVSKAYA